MADDAQHGPVGGREGDQSPAVGREDWWVAEGRKLFVLRVALRAMLQVGKVGETRWLKDEYRWPCCPVPSPERGEELKKVLEDVRSDGFNVDPRTPKEVEDDFTEQLRCLGEECVDNSDEIGNPSASELEIRICVGNWIESAEMVRKVREYIRLDQEAGAAGLRSVPERLRRWHLWTPRSDRNKNSSRDRTPLWWRFNQLMNLLVKELGASHPVFWCAEQEGPLRLTLNFFQTFIDGKDGIWNRAAADRQECLEHLIKIAGRYRKVPNKSGEAQARCPDDTFRQWRLQLAKAAENLLGQPCEPGSAPLPTWNTIDDWQFETHERGDVTVLARPLFVTASSRKAIAAGVIVVPPIETVRDRMQTWLSNRSPDALPIDAGLVRAIDRTQDGVHGLKLLVPAGGDPSGTPTGQTVVAALEACTRLLVAVEICFPQGEAGRQKTSGPDLTPPEQFRLAAMQSGVFIRRLNAPVYERIIPWRDDDHAGRESGSVPLQLHASKATIQVGTQSVRTTCNPAIFNAIEDRDWRLWAIRQASKLTDAWLPREIRTSLETLLKNVHSRPKWEKCKSAILSSDNDPKRVAECVTFLWWEILALTRASKDSKDDLTGAVLQDTQRCVEAILTHLHAIDPKRLGGLDPPRLPSGEVDIFRWTAQGRRDVSKSIQWEAAWKCSPQPFGTQLEETKDSRTVTVTFSASPGAEPADLALFELALDTVRKKEADDACFAPLVSLGATLLQKPAGGTEMPDVAGALGRLRDEYARPDRNAFDALIRAATAAEPNHDAIRWVKLLRDDGRFRFECHPPIEYVDDAKTFRVKPVSSGEKLEWQDDDAEAGAVVRVEHAIEKEHGVRVLSRGRPEEGSPERLAAELESICRGESDTLATAAEAVRRALDHVRTFPDEPRWSQDLVTAIGTFLDRLLDLATGREAGGGADRPPVENALLVKAFETVSRIGDRCGHGITPVGWDVRLGTSAAAVTDAEQLAVAFHPDVPSGGVIVDRFGIEGDPGRESRCRLSAGKPEFIDGYERLRKFVEPLPGTEPRVLELKRAIADLPRHVLGEKARLAIPSLYESVWNVLVEHPDLIEDQTPWREAIADLVRKPYDMVLFEPAKLGDYPAAWVVGRDGNQPRGRRIARVVRPGVRTLENKLVWPAIVETE